MKTAGLVLVLISSAFLVGCGASSSAQTLKPPKNPRSGTATPATPEVAITKLETSEDRVIYLHQLAKDSTFEPQEHTEMLQQYAGDKDKEVAAAAQELLDRK